MQSLTDDEIGTVMAQTSCSREAAVDALQRHNNNVVDAILDVTDDWQSARMHEDEIHCVMTQTGCSRARAVDALTKCPNLVDAILSLVDTADAIHSLEEI
jgi:NACalpha-BTF3-like transcription factor